MATAIPSCNICQSRGLHKDAMVWCSECDELLCDECSEHHGISKSSKHHKTQPVDDYLNLPAFILSAKDQCDDHGSKYEFYCPSHDCLCCVQCIHEKHKDCEQLSPLTGIVNGIKDSSLLNDIEVTVHELVKNFKILIGKCQHSIESLTSTMHKCKTHINELRQTVEAHIKKIEKEILEDLSNRYNKCLKLKEKLLKDLESASDRVASTADTLVIMKKHASDMQIFLGLREVERLIREDNVLVESFIEGDILKDSEFQFEISPAIFYITSDFTLLGQISLVESSMNISLETLKRKEAQTIKSHTRNIHHYRVRNSSTIAVPNGKCPLRMTGCTIMPSNDIIIADKNNDRLVVIDSFGKFKKEIAIVGSPVDVCSVYNDQVAVSLANKPKIKVINVHNGNTCNKFPLLCTGYGVSNSDADSVVVRMKDYGFFITNKSGKSSKLVHVPGDCILYVSYHNEKLYYTKWDVDKVFCCDMTGNILWEFSNEILKKPCGISMSPEGNIFVAGFQSNNIILISPDGKQYRELIKEKDSLNNPAAIHFDNELQQLAVVNLNDGKCSVFDLDS